MRFSIDRDNILQELHLFQGIVEKRNTMPILANILIQTVDNEIELAGTDLEVGLKSHFSAKVNEPGSITISGKKLFEIVRSLPEGQEINFVVDEDHKMDITSGQSHFKVLCLPKEDYPQIPEAKFEKNIGLPLPVLQEMIDRVYFSITQEQRYYLNGALMILKGDNIELVSTDGHRLAYTSAGVEDLQLETEEIRGIVSKKSLGEMRKLEGEKLEFDLDENNLFFKIGHRTLVSRIIEGKFPNFEAVIPKDNPYSLVLSRDDFAKGIRRVSLLSTERSRGIKFAINGSQVDLFSSNPEIGEARDRVVAEYEGPEIEIGFNSQYLIDFLSNIRTEKVRMAIKDENNAVLMTPEDENQGSYMYVLMPMKI